MEAKDLMVGDLVYHHNEVVRITGIGQNLVTYIYYHYVDCEVTEIEPIPLTAEILEKNGYVYNDSLCEWASDSFCIEFGHEPFEDEPDHLFVWVGNCHVVLRYVHELQNALRLCWIEKEIKL